MDTHLEFPYKPKAHVMLLVAGFFALCGAVLAHVAQTNDRGLLLWHVIHFETEGATVFYWVLAGISGIFVLLGMLGFARSVFATEPQVLKLTPEEIIVPPSLFRFENQQVRWRDVTRITLQEVNGQHLLHLHHGDRKKLTIARSILPDRSAWDTVLAYAASKTPTRTG
jgi:hypothetical protein